MGIPDKSPQGHDMGTGVSDTSEKINGNEYPDTSEKIVGNWYQKVESGYYRYQKMHACNLPLAQFAKKL